MTRFRAISRSVVLALVGAGMVGAPGFSAPVLAQEAEEPVIVAQADCYAIGQQVAAQHGGQLARASRSSRGGQDVCVIVVLVPGKGGQRPRRIEVVVPAN